MADVMDWLQGNSITADKNAKLADFAQNQFGQSNPFLADYAKADPDGFRTFLGNYAQQQQQQNAISSLLPQQQSVPQASPLAQFAPNVDGASVGDLDPNLGAPQALPDPVTGIGQPASPLAAIATPQQQQTPFLQKALSNYAVLPKELQSVVGTAIGNQLMMGGDPFSAGGGSNQAGYVQKVANRIANYDAAPLSPVQAKTPIGMAIESAVLEQNPDWDQTKYKERQKTANDFSPGGINGQKLTQVQTAVNHLASLQDASDKYGGIESPFLPDKVANIANITRNWLKSASPEAATYNTFQALAGDEVAKAIAGNAGSTEGDRRAREDQLSSSLPPASRKAAIQADVQALFGKLEPAVDQYNRSYGTNKTAFDFLAPETQRSLAKIGITGSDNAQPQTAPLAQAPAPTGQVYVNPKTGQRGTVVNGKWQILQ